MDFTILDMIISAILLYFILRGYNKGFIKQTSTILGLLIAFIAAINYYDNFQEYLVNYIDVSEPLLQFISFAIIFVVLNLVIHIIGIILKNVIDLLFLEPVDHIVGAVLGMVKGGLLVYLLVLVLSQIPYNQVVDVVDKSYMANNLMEITPIIQENIKHIFDHN